MAAGKAGQFDSCNTEIVTVIKNIKSVARARVQGNVKGMIFLMRKNIMMHAWLMETVLNLILPTPFSSAIGQLAVTNLDSGTKLLMTVMKL